MDVRRTCFVENWFFGQGDDTSGKVRWYQAPEGAECYPTPHAFGCLDWWDGLSPLAARPGPVQFERGTYDKGAANPEYEGLSSCGSADWFANGVPSPVPPSPPRDPSGYPFCCGNTAGGAFAITGSSSVKFAWFSAGLAVSGLWTAYSSSSPLNLSWGSVPLGQRCLVAAITAVSSVASSLTLNVPAGWVLLQQDSVGTVAHWLVLYIGAPLTSGTQSFFITGGLAQLAGQLYSVVGVMNEGAVNVSTIETFPRGSTPVICVGPIPNYPYNETIQFYGYVPPTGSFPGCQGSGCFTYNIPNLIGCYSESFQFSDGVQHCESGPGGSMVPFVGSAIAVAGFAQPNSFGLFNVTGSVAVSFSGAASGVLSAAFSVVGAVDVAFVTAALGSSAFSITGGSDAEFAGNGLAPTAFLITGGSDAEFAGNGLAPTAFSITGGSDAEFAGNGLAPTAFAMTGGQTVSFSGQFGVVSTLLGTAQTTSGGGSLTISGVTLAVGDLLIVGVANDTTAATAATWGTNALSVASSHTNSTTTPHFGSACLYYLVPTGGAGTFTLTFTHGSTYASMIAAKVTGLSTAALHNAKNNGGTGTSSTGGPGFTETSPPGPIVGVQANLLADNGSNTGGTFAAPMAEVTHVTSNTGGDDLWLSLGLGGFVPGQTYVSLKNAFTSSRWAGMLDTWH